MTTIRQHLSDRYCNPDLYQNSLIIDEDNRIVTFLLWNYSGQLVGYQQYRPDCHEKHIKNNPEKRYYTFLGEEGETFTKSKKRTGMFGLESIKMFPNGPVFLNEGIFNACRFHWNGYAAIACLSNDPKHIRNDLSFIHRPKIAVCDGDSGGKRLAKFGNSAIHCPDRTDVGSLTEFEFQQLIKDI